MKRVMKKERIISAFRYNAREAEMYERKEVVKVKEEGADGILYTREVIITAIEMRLIESIAMRLVADHERYFAVEEFPDGYRQMILEVNVRTNDDVLPEEEAENR